MPTYVTLINWTDQGIRNFRDTVNRAEAAGEQMEKLGVRIKDLYWTIGAYDIVAVTEADDDESATAALLALGAAGNVRTTTMRAFNGEEMAGIIAKVA